MTPVVPFDFGSATIRTVMKDGEPWFVGRDVALVLGYTNPQKAIRDHCKGVNETFIPSAGGPQSMAVIPERDVYRLIMRSKLPAAERFEEWVVGTVLPSLRKHGGYVVAQETLTNEQVLAPAGQLAQGAANCTNPPRYCQTHKQVKSVCYTLQDTISGADRERGHLTFPIRFPLAITSYYISN